MFDLKNSKDFYQKLLHEFDDFSVQPDSARHAMNCAITAYHLYQWVWNDYLKGDDAIRAKMGIRRDKQEFEAWIHRRTIWFGWIKELCNGSKHFGRPTAFETSRVGGYGQSPFGVGPYGHSYLLIDNGLDAGVHQYMTVPMLIEVVVRFWRDFFRNYSPYESLPVCQTKLMDEQ